MAQEEAMIAAQVCNLNICRAVQKRNQVGEPGSQIKTLSTLFHEQVEDLRDRMKLLQGDRRANIEIIQANKDANKDEIKRSVCLRKYNVARATTRTLINPMNTHIITPNSIFAEFE